MKKWLDKIENAIRYTEQENVNVYNWNETLQNYTVVAFGLGKYFEDTHERLFKMCNIAYVTDNNPEKWGKEFYGKRCLSPEEIKSLENPFVIAVMGYYIPVRDQMRSLQIPVMHVGEMHFSNYIKGKDTKWLKAEWDNIKRALDLLADDQSREIFTNVFCNKIYGWETETDYETFVTQGEYFETGILTLDKDEVLIDAGAWVGDTVEDIVKLTNGEFKKIYTYELSSENYIQLKENLGKFDESIQKKIVAINAGVWNKADTLWCTHYGDTDGCQIVEEEQGEFARLVALDDEISSDEKITFLKMDIEGAEQNAIEGAKRIICQNKPKLAICLYHCPEDLWQIPLRIKELVPEYKIFIRYHGGQNYTDSVCYAYVE